MSVEGNLPKDLGNFQKLEMLVSSFREKLEEVRVDPNLGERIHISEGRAEKRTDSFYGKIDWFTQYHALVFEKWRIPEMVSVYKLTTGTAELPTDPNEFFDAFAQIPEWRKRQGGIRKEIANNLAQAINGPLVERVPSNWIYFTMQLIDLAENYQGVNFGAAREFERYLKDDPPESGERLSVYQTLAYLIPIWLAVLDSERDEQVIDCVRSVVNVYTNLVQNSRGSISEN